MKQLWTFMVGLVIGGCMLILILPFLFHIMCIAFVIGVIILIFKALAFWAKNGPKSGSQE